MRLFFLIILLLGVYYYSTDGDILSSSGSLVGLAPILHASDDPIQSRLKISKTKKIGNFSLKLHNGFDIKALVLSKKNYKTDRESRISPVDLALGWGKMSNPAPLRRIKISQSNRFYYFRYSNPPPIPHRYIEKHSANMHIIPANDNIKKILKKVKKGSVVHMKGYLVDIKGKNGYYWNSSRTRNDTGHGACEVFLVEEINL